MSNRVQSTETLQAFWLEFSRVAGAWRECWCNHQQETYQAGHLEEGVYHGHVGIFFVLVKITFLDRPVTLLTSE